MKVLIIKSTNGEIEYYVRRVSTTRNGIKGSYPVYSRFKDDAHQFMSIQSAMKSIESLKKFDNTSTFTAIDIVSKNDQTTDSNDKQPVQNKSEQEQAYTIRRAEFRIPINSVLSMIHKTKILTNDIDGKIVELSSTHQAFAYAKAYWAGDEEIASKILETKDISEISRLSRQVKISDVEEYDEIKDELMEHVLLNRMSQDSEFADALTSTKDAVLVVLSTNDYWGDNYGKGRNVLGKLLEKVRDLDEDLD